MPRPTRCRRIRAYPDYWSFVPQEAESPQTLDMSLDEYEALRLIDYEGMTQEECAQAMGVSRATVANIYASVRFKLADALVNGKLLRITGGTYRIADTPLGGEIGRKGEGAMRITVTYEEGMVGQHFGRTQQFKLYDVIDGSIVSSQVVGTGGKGHGALAGVLKVADVDALICGGIGMGARVALSEAGIQLFPGVTGSADEAAAALVAGTLDADLDATCDHHGHGEGHDCHHHGSGCGEHGCHE